MFFIHLFTILDIASAAIFDALRGLWCQLSEFLAFPIADLRFSFLSSSCSQESIGLSWGRRKIWDLWSQKLESEDIGRLSGKQGSTLCEDLSHSQSSEGGNLLSREARGPPGRGVNEGLPDSLKGCSYGFYSPFQLESELKTSTLPIRAPIRGEMLNRIYELDSRT